jgi:hypothetical protein
VDDVPYAVLDVTLEEGPRINGRLLNAPFSQIAPDLPVRAVFEDLPDFTRLAFEPTDLEESWTTTCRI